MCVTECINVEDINVTGRHENVLDKAGEHVPGVEEQATGNEIERIGRYHSDNDFTESALVDQC